MRGFANCFTLIVPYLALCQSRYTCICRNPVESTMSAPCAASSPAIQPIISCSMKSSVCHTRKRHHDLPYGRSSPRRSKSPGCLAKCLANPHGTALPGFQDGRWYGRDAPVLLAFGNVQQFTYEVGYLSHPFYIVAALGLAALGVSGPVNVRIVPLAGGVVLASGQVWLAYLWPSVFLFMPAIRIGDRCAFRSRARAVLSVGIAGSFSFWTRPTRAPPLGLGAGRSWRISAAVSDWKVRERRGQPHESLDFGQGRAAS